MARTRIDVLLVERGLAQSRAQAQALIMAGKVRLDGEVMLKAGTAVHAEARIEVEAGPRFVSRGGEKLEAALVGFGIDVAGRICADVGASTGGFTDCLLQRGAAKVYSIDVGKGILDWKLRKDPRVVVMEGTNARFVTALPEPVALTSIDASFISLRVLLPVVRGWLAPSGDVVTLIKPQFEAGRRDAARGKGVIRDARLHAQILNVILKFAASRNLESRGLMRSPLVGPKGNIEFLAWFSTGSGERGDIAAFIDNVTAPPAKSKK